MPRGRDTKVWNDDLVRACEARNNAALSRQSRVQFQWQKARDIIKLSRKEIYITSTQKIRNMPKDLSDTVRAELENIMRGHPIIGERYEAFDPANASTNAAVPPSAGDHVLLRNMQHRGGSYAILMAFHVNAPNGVLTKAQICQLAQPFCNDPMDSDFRAGRVHNYGWQSHKGLIEKGLLHKVGGGAHYGANGWRAAAGQYRLSHEAKAVIQAMIEKYGDGGYGGGGSFRGSCHGRSSSSFDDAHDGMDEENESRHAAGVRSSAAGFSTPRDTGLYTPTSSSTPRGPMPSVANEKNATDDAELRRFAATAHAGERKEFDVSKARREYLHKLIDSGILQHEYGVQLHKSSYGHGASRAMLVTMVSRVSEPSRILGGATAQTPAPAVGSKRARSTAGGTASATRLPAREGLTPRDAAAQAAERRFADALATAAQASADTTALASADMTPLAPLSIAPPRSVVPPSTAPRSMTVEISDDEDEDGADPGYWICPQCDEVNASAADACAGDDCFMPHPKLLDAPPTVQRAAQPLATTHRNTVSSTRAQPSAVVSDVISDVISLDDDDDDDAPEPPARRPRTDSRSPAATGTAPACAPQAAGSTRGLPAAAHSVCPPASALTSGAVAGGASGTVRLLIDERERLSERRPIGIYLDLERKLRELSCGRDDSYEAVGRCTHAIPSRPQPWLPPHLPLPLRVGICVPLPICKRSPGPMRRCVQSSLSATSRGRQRTAPSTTALSSARR